MLPFGEKKIAGKQEDVVVVDIILDGYWIGQLANFGFEFLLQIGNRDHYSFLCFFYHRCT